MSRTAPASGFEELYAQVQGAIGEGYTKPSLAGLFSSFQVSVPQIDAHVDRERAKTYGVPLTDVFDTLQVYLGSLYANDFNRFGRTYQVNVQAESGFRLRPEQIRLLRTSNADGAMVPLGSLVTVDAGLRPRAGDALQRVPGRRDQRRRRLLDSAPARRRRRSRRCSRRGCPASMAFEWTELAYQEVDRRQHDDLHLPAVRAARLCRARGAVRELVAAAQPSS